MHELFTVIRWIHIIAAAVWLGQLVLINAVILPVVSKLSDEVRMSFLKNFMLKSFTFAAHISLTAVVTGILLLFYHVKGDMYLIYSGRWGISILIGFILATFSMIHNFRMKKKLNIYAKEIADGQSGPPPMPFMSPKVGLILVAFTFILMMFAVRGF